MQKLTMLLNFLKPDELKNVWNKFDIFSLGNSTVIRFISMFGIVPLALLFGIRSGWRFNFVTGSPLILSVRVICIVAVAIIMFVIGYNLLPVVRKKSEYSKFSLGASWNTGGGTLAVFVIIFFIGLAVKVVRIYFNSWSGLSVSPELGGSVFYGLMGIAGWFSTIAIIIAFINYNLILKTNNGHRILWLILAWAAFFIDFAYGFISGSKTLIVVPIIAYLMVDHYANKKNFLKVIICAVLVLAIIFPAANYIRSIGGVIPNGQRNASQGMNLNINNVPKFVSDTSIYRFDQFTVLIPILDNVATTPRSYIVRDFFISLIPRFFWPNKPATSALGNELGRRLGALSPDDTTTSIGPTVIGDLYMNFSTVGIIFGMFLMGLVFRWIYNHLIIRNGAKFSALLIYIIMWIEFMLGMEGWVAPYCAGIVKLIIAMLIIHIALTWKRNVTAQA